MKFRIFLLFIVCYIYNSEISAQDITKLNKSELRDQVIGLTIVVDSLQKEIQNLEQARKRLVQNVLSLELSNKKVEFGLVSQKEKNDLLEKNVVEKDSLISINQKLMLKLNTTIKLLKDSILALKSDLNLNLNSESFNRKDFLNNYYFNQIPLANNTFQLVLSKVIYAGWPSFEEYPYNDEENQKNIPGFYRGILDNENRNQYVIPYSSYSYPIRHDIPEILDPGQFTFYGVKPNVLINSGTNFNDYLIIGNSDIVNSKLPKIEILKNKLFTLKYINGEEESFLFNVRKLTTSQNNQRSILQIELANEEVKEDGTNNTAKDIVWRFYVIKNECYLALSTSQLSRLKLLLLSPEIGLQVYSGNKDDFSYIQNFNGYYSQKTTGAGIYLSRNKDIYMNESKYINPLDLIYLFKLNELQ